MKNSILLLIICLFITTILQAQVSKTINVTAGGLYSALTVTERNTITSLKITGSIDATDFKTMRDNLLKLAIVDLSGANISAYTGIFGTLKETNISYSANTIPYAAFYNTWQINLTSIVLPSSVTYIDGLAFQDCSKLTSVTIPSSVSSIGEYAFRGCSGLTSVTIPSSVTSIKGGAFSGCGLTSITIPLSVTLIGAGAFQYCGNLTSVTIASSITSIESGTFEKCYRLSSFTIPLTVTSIGKSAFNYCKALTSINIPSSVESIGESAFLNCYELKSIYVNTITPVALSLSNTFDHVSKINGILYVPKGTINAYRTANVWKDFRNVQEFLTTDIKITNSGEISLYPNPTTDGCRIRGLNGTSSLKLFDSKGKLIISKEIENNEYISLNSLSRGVYFVNVTSKSKSFERKVVKK